MDLSRIDTIVQFSEGSNTAWTDVNIAVPVGAVVIDTVNKIIKEGDGVTLFGSLPVCLDYNFSGGASGAVDLNSVDNDSVVISTNAEYAPGANKLTAILNSIISCEGIAVSQGTAIAATSGASVVLAVSEGVVDGTIVVCAGGKYAAGTKTVAQMISDLILNTNSLSNKMHIDDLVWYSDRDLTQVVETPNNLIENNTYWCKITGFHDTTELRNVDFGLATTNGNVTVTSAVDYVTHGIIAAVYGWTSSDVFLSTTTDSSDNIICVGHTYSEGAGGSALVVKFDSSLNILARKIYGGSGLDQFNDVVIDSADNVICVGGTFSEGPTVGSLQSCFLVKFDSNLNILARKVYGGSGTDAFQSVTVDSINNIICVGSTSSEGVAAINYHNALVVKFDTNLNILARKIYGGTHHEYFVAVTADSSDNIICAGYTYSEGTAPNVNHDGLIVKFDTNLNIVTRKTYGGASGQDAIVGVTADSSDNIICVGSTNSEGAGGHAGLIVKFDSSLNILARKIYGGAAGDDQFFKAAIDSANNITVIGWTPCEGVGSPTYQNALVVKFDTNLNILARKIYSGSNADWFNDVVVDSSDNVICVGQTGSEGSGATDALVLKLPSAIPAGTFTGTVLTGLTLADSNLTLANSSLTLANSALTLADSTLTLSNSALTLTDSSLTLEKDIIVASRTTVPTTLITVAYSSANADQFLAVTMDALGNYIVVGFTEIDAIYRALVVKFDSGLNVIARKLYSATPDRSIFKSVVTNSTNEIICVGSVDPSNAGANNALIVKFSADLTSIIAHKVYSGIGSEVFNDVITDASNNYICVGITTSEGSGTPTYWNALIVKFDNNLSILVRKVYGGNVDDTLISITTDPVGNYICVGHADSEGPNRSGLILKLDTNLNVVLRKIYNSTASSITMLSSVAVTSANVVICAGSVVSTADSKSRGLIVKLDSTLNVVANKTYGSAAGNTEFSGVKISSTGDIVCVGRTNAEGAGDYDALIVKMSIAFAILGRKTYGTIDADSDIDCVLNADDDVIISGYAALAGNPDGLITKLDSELAVGTYTNKIFTSMILSDSRLDLVDDAGTLSNSGLTMTDSALTLTNSSLSLSNATGAVKRDVTIMDAVSNTFKVKFGNVATGIAEVPVGFNVTTNDGNLVINKDIEVLVRNAGIIAAVYGGSGSDNFLSTTVDSIGNVICAGYTYSEGTGSAAYNNAFVVKFDTNLNILARKIYSGSSTDWFNGVVVDSSDNVICVGHTQSIGAGYNDALVVKFDTNLNILAHKIYGGIHPDYFISVAVDSSNNIICAGATNSEGTGAPSYPNALIVKFDSSLNILARKYYHGAVSESFQGITVDSNDNIICAGATASEGTGSTTYDNALVVKFDTNLNILARKIYGGTYNDQFRSVAVDSVNNIICVGLTNSEGAGSYDTLVVKFDSNLNILARKIYSGSGNDEFHDVAVDSNNNIICAGFTYSEGAGIPTYNNALVVKFDSNLNILARKYYGGANTDQFSAVTVDSNDNIVLVGSTASEGLGSSDALVVKLPSDIPAGVFSGTTLTNLTWNDSHLTLANSTLTLANSALTVANSTLTLANSALTLADSALTLERDII